MRYIMKNSIGVIFENTMENEPVSYLHGATAILPLLQAQLEGLKAGDRIQVYLAADQGSAGEDFVFDVMPDQVRPASAEEILLGYPVQGTLSKCTADCGCHTQQTVQPQIEVKALRIR